MKVTYAVPALITTILLTMPLITFARDGLVIIDNTAAANNVAVKTNLGFKVPGSKGDTPIGNPHTPTAGNAIDVQSAVDFKTVNRNINANPHSVTLRTGADAAANDVSAENFGTDTQLNYFADGEHLFNLDRLRAAADWLGTHASPDSGIQPSGRKVFGTLSMEQFLQNVAEANTMYGIVRVKIGLQRGACGNNADCVKNALGNTVDPTTVYGFCARGNTTGLCACAPNSGWNIKAGESMCGISIRNDARIKVKGALLWDFVDSDTGEAIPLSALPIAPRKLYFKVTVPILVNWDDASIDNAGALTSTLEAKIRELGQSTINMSDLPLISKYNFQMLTGKTLVSSYSVQDPIPQNEALFSAINRPSQYHLLMPSAYAQSWAEAFNALNITKTMWTSGIGVGLRLPADSPADADITDGDTSSDWQAKHFHSTQFEDIPAYLYSGGLIDMHGNVNISGLVYVPQAMELEAKSPNVVQYIVGAVVVRDGFYIEAHNANSTTIISADPSSYSTATIKAATPSLSFVAAGPGTGTDSGNNGGDPNTPPEEASLANFIAGVDSGVSGGNSGADPAYVASPKWIEIRPAPPAPGEQTDPLEEQQDNPDQL